ncbi:MAG: AAA family ATPase, partial [Dehalococcoidia bacterium]
VIDEAKSYYSLARSYALAALPELSMLIVMGMPGTGKTTLAQALARHWGLPVLSSDLLRKRLGGLAPTQHAYASFGEGLYSEQADHETYGALMVEAEGALKSGSLILDASFRAPEFRERAAQVAQRAGGTAWFIECTATDDRVRERIRKRVASGKSPSDATYDVHERVRDTWVSMAAPPGAKHIVVDTGGSPPVVLSAAVRRLFEAAISFR